MITGQALPRPAHRGTRGRTAAHFGTVPGAVARYAAHVGGEEREKPSGQDAAATPQKLIKGTMLVDQVRMIRANKNLAWDDYLQPEDWALIRGRILSSSWYPLAVYERCGWATFKVLANGDLDLVRERGRARGTEMFETTYKALTEVGSPARALELFVRGYSLLFNFSALRLESVGPEHVRIHHEYASSDKTNAPYCHQLLGHLEALVHATGGTETSGTFLGRAWDGDDRTIIDLRWTAGSP